MASCKADFYEHTPCPRCKVVGQFIIPLEEAVYLECIRGHGRHEPYAASGGTRPKPGQVVHGVEDLLSAEHRELYRCIRRVLAKDSLFNEQAGTIGQINYFCRLCGADEQAVYTVFKMITLYHKAVRSVIDT
ncbi:MAG TPA: hypothetical protein GX699_04775 [Firmicutes bacterium]|nr:hypothetical protein [Bacillota bacterium]